MGVAADEQRAVVALRRAVATDRLADREDVILVECAAERRAAVARRPEGHALGRVGWVRDDVVVGAQKGVDIDQGPWVGRLAGPIAGGQSRHLADASVGRRGYRVLNRFEASIARSTMSAM